MIFVVNLFPSRNVKMSNWIDEVNINLSLESGDIMCPSYAGTKTMKKKHRHLLEDQLQSTLILDKYCSAKWLTSRVQLRAISNAFFLLDTLPLLKECVCGVPRLSIWLLVSAPVMISWVTELSPKSGSKLNGESVWRFHLPLPQLSLSEIEKS